jgi:hypothetical protein
MILLMGIPSETPLRLVREALEARGADVGVFNQRDSANSRINFSISDKGVEGELVMPEQRIDLTEITAAYTRLMDDLQLPEVEAAPVDSPVRSRVRALHDALYRWIETAPGRIVNRSEPQGSNGSKPYQAQLILPYGFLTPETLISNDPDQVRAFHASHGPLIYKSISGIRSIVAELDVNDAERLERIRWCPVQFQQRVEGTDIRVHVIGEDVHATEIATDGVDYRYAVRDGGSTELRAIELSDDIAKRCIALTKGLGLALSGIDLRRTPDADYYCFEVNPSPAFSYYELNTGQPISTSIAAYLDGA